MTRNRMVLWISYSFPPIIDAESIQSAGYAKYMTRRGWRCFVITSKLPNYIDGDSTFQEVLKSVIIKRVSDANGAKKKVARAINWLAVRLPCSHLDWIYPAYREALRICREEQIAAIHTWAQPQVDSLIGLLLKRVTNLPWISHISDLWVGSPYAPHAALPHHLVNSWFEREVVSKADVIVFTANRTKQIYEQRYPAFACKFRYIPNAFDPELIENKNNVKLAIRDAEQIVIGYLGTLYGQRTPVPFLEMFSNYRTNQPWMQKIRFEFVGRRDRAIEEKMHHWIQEGLVNIEPAVGYRESLHRMQQYDICLLLDALVDKGGVFMPSKLADYLGARKPVLAITPKNSESRDIVLRAGGVACDPRDAADFERAMTRLAEIVGNSQRVDVPTSIRVSLSMQVCAAQLEAAFLNAIQANKHSSSG